jgi:hypothetical protein
MKTFYLSILVAILLAGSFTAQSQGIYQKNTEEVGNNGNSGGNNDPAFRAGGTENEVDGGRQGRMTPVGDGEWVILAGSLLFGLVIWKREKKKRKV